MTGNSAIEKTAIEYEALQIVLQGFTQDNQDIPDLLLGRRASLVQRMIASPAASGQELARKANVLLDWVDGGDLTSKLTVSLCNDTVRVFPLSANLTANT